MNTLSENDIMRVGVEFVRHYYNIMRTGPHQLYRFYYEASVFKHGEVATFKGVDEIKCALAVIDYRGCKVFPGNMSVQKTMGKGVVVQVTGRLALRPHLGQVYHPRSFMQSFVLIERAPRRYYIHNDILQYIDGSKRQEPVKPIFSATGLENCQTVDHRGMPPRLGEASAHDGMGMNIIKHGNPTASSAGFQLKLHESISVNQITRYLETVSFRDYEVVMSPSAVNVPQQANIKQLSKMQSSNKEISH